MMKRHKKMRAAAAMLLILALAMSFVLAGCGSAGGRFPEDRNASGKVGMFSNLPDMEKALREKYPNVEVMYFYSAADLILALKTDKIDAFMLDELTYLNAARSENGIVAVEEPVCGFRDIYVFADNERCLKMREQFNAMLAEMKQDGSFDEITAAWPEGRRDGWSFDPSQLPAENGSVKFALDALNPPYTMIVNGGYGGIDVEMLETFCRRYGYGMTIEETQWTSMIGGVKSGKYDVGASNTIWTEQMEEEVKASDYVCEKDMLLIVSAEDHAPGFFGSLAESFRKTLIAENRWKQLLAGLGVTLHITALSMILGTVLGFAAYGLARLDRRWLNGLLVVIREILDCLPTVLLLMILYYGIFGKTRVSGVTVATLGFSMLFALRVYSLLESGASAVDPGQLKGALALGYPRRKAFLKFVLPQAIEVIIPMLGGEVIGLIKSTAIVGYIAVSDLTRVGDLIRGRTFEPFFPLIVCAVLYYLLIKLNIRVITALINRTGISRRDPEKFLKGVER